MRGVDAKPAARSAPVKTPISNIDAVSSPYAAFVAALLAAARDSLDVTAGDARLEDDTQQG
jgi:hypothetical protein